MLLPDWSVLNAIVEWLSHGLWDLTWWEIVIYALVTTHITIAGVTIYLLSADGSTVIDSVVTDGSGDYQFTGITPGVDYLVCEAVTSGWTQSFPSNTLCDGATGAMLRCERNPSIMFACTSGPEIFPSRNGVVNASFSPWAVAPTRTILLRNVAGSISGAWPSMITCCDRNNE